MLDLARSLKQLSDNSSSSLTDLSIGVLPNMKLMETLLNASPNLRSLTVEIHPMPEGVRTRQRETAESADMKGAVAVLTK